MSRMPGSDRERPIAVLALAVEATRSGRVGVLATPATVASGAFAAAIAATDPRVHVESVPWLVSSGEGVARAVEQALAPRGPLRARTHEGAYRFHATGDVEAFRTRGTRCWQMPLGEVERVTPTPVEVAA